MAHRGQPGSDDVIELASALIRLPTVNPPGRERLAADLLAPRLERAGFSVTVIDQGDDRVSLIARRGGGDREPLILSGHLDVVPPGTAPWTGGPFEPRIADGRLYGRGATDMKGGVAAIVVAVERLAGVDLHGPLVLALSADEESGATGAAAIGQHPDFPRSGRLLIAEPTGMRVGVAEKGALWLVIRATGQAAHGAYPEQGANAIEGVFRAVPILRELVAATPSHPELGHTTMNVAMIGGGSAPNMVADEAWVRVDLRTVPGVSHDAIVEALLTRWQTDGVPGVGLTIEVPSDFNSFATDPSDPFVVAIADETRAATGTAPEIVGMRYYTDAAELHRHGSYVTAILGAGDPSIAHQIDEWIDVDLLRASVDIYEGVVRRLLA